MADEAKLIEMQRDTNMERITRAIRLIESLDRVTERVEWIVEQDRTLKVDQIGTPLDSYWRKSLDALREQCDKLMPKAK